MKLLISVYWLNKGYCVTSNFDNEIKAIVVRNTLNYKKVLQTPTPKVKGKNYLLLYIFLIYKFFVFMYGYRNK